MTREKAIKSLRFVRNALNDDMEIAKAYDMAIKVLEHPERNVVAVVPCGDCVSRAEVLKLMKDNWHTHDGDWAMQESIDDIRALPSVTPQEPKTGHWKHDRVNIRCSNCGRGYKDAFGRTSAITYNFCPNCGADMREVEE